MKKKSPSVGRSVQPEAPEAAVHAASLSQLDALVGKYVTGLAPTVYWEDSYTHWRFESLPEALESMRDPFFTAFTPQESRPRSSLKEVHEYPAYSGQLLAALKVVELLSSEDRPFTLWASAEKWSAQFADGPAVEADSAPVAICLAALRGYGVEVTFDIPAEATETPESDASLHGSFLKAG